MAKKGQKRTAQKSAKTCEKKSAKNGRKQAKAGENVRKRSGCFLLNFFGHFPVKSGGYAPKYWNESRLSGPHSTCSETRGVGYLPSVIS